MAKALDSVPPAFPSERTIRLSQAASRTAEEVADYLMEIGQKLARYACPSYRIEQLLRALAADEDHDASVFAVPTALFVTVRPRHVIAGAAHVRPVHRMERLDGWSIDLDRLIAIDEIFNDVAAGRRTIDSGRVELRRLDERPAPYPELVKLVASFALSAAAAVFFRGGLVEVLAAGGIALVVHLLAAGLTRRPSGGHLVDFAGAFVASSVALLVARWVPTSAREVMVLAGMIALFPGMTFTTGLAEIAQKHLVSGGARLVEAMMTFLSLVFGIALSIAGYHALFGPPHVSPARVALPLPFQLLALIAVSFGFGVAFAVPRRWLWAALVSGATSYVVTSTATRFLPAHLASFLASFVVCTVANGLARKTGRPAQLFQLPGMMLLVPGSFGFLSLDDFVHGDFMSGAARGVQMLLIAGGLVMGVLFANLVLPAKKML